MSGKIDESDIAYHKFVMKQVQDAQTVANAWSTFLSGKYKLGQGDSISAEGEIVRSTEKEKEPEK